MAGGHFGAHFGVKVVQLDNTICEIGQLCALRGNAELKIYPITRGPTVLQWDLAKIEGVQSWEPPIEVAIDTAPLDVEDINAWTEIAAYEERDGLYTDEFQRMFGQEFNSHYRLRLRNGVGDIYTTNPISIFEEIPQRMKAVYLESNRRWTRRMDRGELRKGVLLKKKRWGAQCPECRDRDGGQQIESRCRTCYDVGFDGGYYIADQCFGVDAEPGVFSKDFDFGRGSFQQGPFSKFVFRNTPQVFIGDVWVDLSSDERWLLGSPMKTTMRVGNVQLFRSCPAVRLDTTHIVYDYPATETQLANQS